jgi:hypothetical protein
LTPNFPTLIWSFIAAVEERKQLFGAEKGNTGPRGRSKTANKFYSNYSKETEHKDTLKIYGDTVLELVLFHFWTLPIV